MRILTAAGLALSLVLLAELALAVDGVVEINQASALEGSLDGAPGFPVRIEQPGSYRVTGNLEVATFVDAFRITSSNVTLDLNGFEIRGAGDEPAGSTGVWVEGAVRNVEVRNGTLSNFTSGGVFVDGAARGLRFIGLRVIGNGGTGMQIQSEGSIVRDCTLLNNAFGMRVFPSGLVTGNLALDNEGFGMRLQGVAWGGNVAAQNNGGNTNPQVILTSGTSEIAPNFCGTNTTCP